MRRSGATEWIVFTPSVVEFGVAFAGVDDPSFEPSDYGRGARMFKTEYIIEEVSDRHPMDPEHSPEFADRLLAHL